MSQSDDDLDFDAEEATPQDGLEWVQKEVVRLLLERHCPDLLAQDRAPVWAIVAMDASRACLAVLPLIDFGAVISRVRADEGLQHAITSAYRMGAGAHDIVGLIQDWKA